MFGAALALGACGTSDPPTTASSELVVDGAGMGVGPVSIAGTTSEALYWAAGSGKQIQATASSLVALPASPEKLGNASGPLVFANDHVLYVTDEGAIMRSSIGAPAEHAVRATGADALGESPDLPSTLVWSLGPVVSWGQHSAEGSVSLTKVTHFTQLFVTARSIYADAETKLVRIDRATGTDTTAASATKLATHFPSVAADGATYSGRLVAADDAGALWLVEESPSKRAILISVPESGDPVVLLEHITNASAFFVTDDAFYWQEGDALLTAPREGGAASIAAQLPGQAGAIADGFVYFVDGDAILRLAL